jgi:hypothetical protein
MFYFRSGTKRKRLQDSVKAKKGNREKQEPKNKGNYEGKNENTYRINIPTRGLLYNRDCYIYTKGREFSFHLAACKIITPICKPSPISFIVPPNVPQLELTNRKATSTWRR